MRAIEINGSHYALQSPERYQNWHDATPADFVFTVKAPRYITHILRLREDKTPIAIANFLASGVFRLRGKLGAILWQFPPSFAFSPDLFENFLARLPARTEDAAGLAREHDSHVKEAFLRPDRSRRMRHAIEIRHASFCDTAFIKLLRKYRAALVMSDAVAKWPYAEDITADFAYLRLHGTETRYSGHYSDAALDRWADRMRIWARGEEPEDAEKIAELKARRRAGRDIYCFFDNDQKVHAPVDARRLIQRVNPDWRPEPCCED